MEEVRLPIQQAGQPLALPGSDLFETVRRPWRMTIPSRNAVPRRHRV